MPDFSVTHYAVRKVGTTHYLPERNERYKNSLSSVVLDSGTNDYLFERRKGYTNREFSCLKNSKRFPLLFPTYQEAQTAINKWKSGRIVPYDAASGINIRGTSLPLTKSQLNYQTPGAVKYRREKVPSREEVELEIVEVKVSIG